MTQPLVSVFIPYYNDEDFLIKSIESVLRSSYQNFELILLNHATTDKCREIARSYADRRIKHIDMEKNYGAGGGLLFEEMLKIATGKYIKPFCADDVLREDGLQILVEYMENNPKKDFAFGNVEYIDKNGEDLFDNWFDTREHFSINLTEIDLICCYARCMSFLPWAGSIIKKDALKNIKLNKTFVMFFDMSLWLSLLCKGCKVGFINKLVADYRIHENQVSALGKENLSAKLGFWEWATFWKCFLDIDDINLVKEVFPTESLTTYLTEEEDIPFVVAHALMDTIRPYPYIYLSDIMNDNEKRKHVEAVFNYGIKELRDDCKKDYSSSLVSSGSWFKNFKRNLYTKSVKNLRIRDMIFLGFRRFFNIILSPLHKLKKKKKYSL